MSEEINNIEMIPEFKMYITDLETGKDSKEINVSNLIFNDYIEFEFGDYEDENYATLPYKDFKFFINDYSITIYSPQMKKLEDQLQQKENIIKEVREYITSYESIDTIQSLEDIEKNINFDGKTMIEMVRRYMIVHDKLLEILDKENK